MGWVVVAIGKPDRSRQGRDKQGQADKSVGVEKLQNRNLRSGAQD